LFYKHTFFFLPLFFFFPFAVPDRRDGWSTAFFFLFSSSPLLMRKEHEGFFLLCLFFPRGVLIKWGPAIGMDGAERVSPFFFLFFIKYGTQFSLSPSFSRFLGLGDGEPFFFPPLSPLGREWIWKRACVSFSFFL